MAVAVAIIFVTAAYFLGTGDSEGDGRASTRTTNQYTQTWPKDYDATTCAEFRTEMTFQERVVAIADMLSAARNADGGRGIAPADLRGEFYVELWNACEVIPSESLAAAAGTLYHVEQTRFGP